MFTVAACRSVGYICLHCLSISFINFVCIHMYLKNSLMKAIIRQYLGTNLTHPLSHQSKVMPYNVDFIRVSQSRDNLSGLLLAPLEGLKENYSLGTTGDIPIEKICEPSLLDMTASL